MGSGPVVIGYDDSAASRQTVREAAALLAPRPAIVVVVWEAGLAYETLSAGTIGLPPATIDVRAAMEINEEERDRAQRLAQQGAALAREVGFEAEGLVVADEVPVGKTLARVAEERDSQAIVVGARRKKGLPELLGSTARDVLRHAPCPVVVIRDPSS
jgi:nucleotide-binding universal stress UspA family protein